MIWAVVITPLCWFGSPHDFWFVAPTALAATVIACVLIMVKESLDVGDSDSCYGVYNNITNGTDAFEPNFPDGIKFLGFGEGWLVGCYLMCCHVCSGYYLYINYYFFSIFPDHVCLLWISQFSYLPSRHEK